MTTTLYAEEPQNLKVGNEIYALKHRAVIRSIDGHKLEVDWLKEPEVERTFQLTKWIKRLCILIVVLGVIAVATIDKVSVWSWIAIAAMIGAAWTHAAMQAVEHNGREW